MEELKFTIPLTPRTKKNSQQIAYKRIKSQYGNTKKVPFIRQGDAYRRYEADCGWYMPKIPTITQAVNLKAVFYMPNHRRVDLVNLQEALCDILVKYRVIEDDSYIYVQTMDGSRVLVDKDNPRTEITITEVCND